MKKLEAFAVERVALLTTLLLLINLLSGVTFGNPASISHRHINVERRLVDPSSDAIKIDCGSEPDGSAPGYLPDASFIDTGKNMYIQPQYSITSLDQTLRTVRSFPVGERNCYTLHPSGGANKKYLIQLRFMYGNYDQQNQIPIFDVYIGVNPLWTVNLNKTDFELFNEVIYKPKTDFIYICLVNIGQGTPFISEIVLRPLNNSTIYESNLGALRTSTRYHTLSSATSSDDVEYYGRYADDPYSRFWTSPARHWFGNWKYPIRGKELITINNDQYEVPSSILESRAEPQPGKISLNLSHTPDSARDIVHYFYWHFVEIEKLANGELREFMISMNGNRTLGPIRPVHLKALTVVSPPLTLGPEDSKIWFSITQTNASTLPPILNALEIMVVINFSHVETNQDDVKAITDVKRSYSLIKGWQADPCGPKVAWDGLICSSNYNDPPTITSLNLSSKGLNGEILPSLSGLTSLIYLDLSHNALMGMIPEFLAKLPSLKVLNLRGNNLSGPIPTALMDKVKNNFLSMSLDDNPYLCSSILCSVEPKSKKIHILAPIIASSAAFIVVLVVAVVFYTIRRRKMGSISRTISDGRMKLKNRQFTYSEVICMTNNFQRIIGKGAYGTVYYGSLEDSTEVAVKMLNQPSAMISFQTEAELLTRVHHKNLVSLIGYCNEGKSGMALIYEYMANGNLQEHLSENKAYTSTPG